MGRTQGDEPPRVVDRSARVRRAPTLRVVRPAPVRPALFAALAGVPVARSLEVLAGADARLEWPNDVHVGGRKVAGALAHATSDGDGGVLVLGIGINVHQRPEDFPAELG